jgi:DNA-binding Lrp family transcriptional regulator
MDEVDLRILRSLVWRPDDAADASRGIVGAWDIAKDLAMHGTSVKRRIEQMQKDGVLAGIRVLPNFQILGIQGALYLFSFPNVTAKRQGFARMLPYRRPGGPFFLARIESFVGNEAMCAVTSPRGSDLDAAARQVADELGATSWQLLEVEEWSMKTDKITALDRGILHALHRDALRSISEIAAELKVTPKTVRTRLKALAAAHAFEIVPDMAPAMMKGFIPHIVFVRPKAGKQKEATASLFNAFPTYFLRSHPGSAPTPYVYLGGENTKSLEENLASAQDLPHVEEARLLLFEDSASCVPPDGVFPPLAEFLERSIAELKQAPKLVQVRA